MVSSRFIIAVIGVDKVGIVAGITQKMADYNVNIVDISQTIMEDMFTMIMLAAVNGDNFDLSSFQKAMSEKDEAAAEAAIKEYETLEAEKLEVVKSFVKANL